GRRRPRGGTYRGWRSSRTGSSPRPPGGVAGRGSAPPARRWASAPPASNGWPATAPDRPEPAGGPWRPPRSAPRWPVRAGSGGQPERRAGGSAVVDELERGVDVGALEQGDDGLEVVPL